MITLKAICGGFLGAGIGCSLLAIFYATYSLIQSHIEHKKYKKLCKEREEFLKNIPKKIAPCSSTNHNGRKIRYGNESAIYDDDGEMIWNSVSGCCGKAIQV